MNIYQKSQGNLVFLKPDCSFLDSSNASDYKQSMFPVLTPGMHAVIDLGSIEFMDSTGLGALISCLRKLESSTGKMSLCAMRAPVRTLFELVRLYKVFEIFDTEQDAIRAQAS